LKKQAISSTQAPFISVVLLHKSPFFLCPAMSYKEESSLLGPSAAQG